MAPSASDSSIAAAAGGDTATDCNPKHTVADIVYSHFDLHQRDRRGGGHDGGSSSSSSAATRAAAALRSDILSGASWNVTSAAVDGDPGAVMVGNDGDANKVNQLDGQVAEAVVRCLDSAMASVASSKKKDAWAEPVAAVLELVAAFGCGCDGSIGSFSVGNFSVVGGGGTANKVVGGVIAHAVVSRALEYSAVEKDAIRSEASRLLGLCAGRLVQGGKPAASILRNTRGCRGRETTKQASATPSSSINDKDSGVVAGWKAGCLLLVSRGLLPRITDKIARVRSSAIEACSPLLSEGVFKLVIGSELYEDFKASLNKLQNRLLWILSNDSSAANRATVAHNLPLSGPFSAKDNVPSVIERIKDVDLRVRGAALDSLREGILHFGEELTEEERVKILRMGLTKRCPTTQAKTVELLCTSWLKSTKFNPIALLERLNPVLNENVCEVVAHILLRVASSIDCETSVEKGVELVRKHFGAPEIRGLKGMVLKKMNLVDAATKSKGGIDQDDNKVDDEDDNGKKGSASNSGNDIDNEHEDDDTDEKLSLWLSPSVAFFLRVKCAVAAASNKSEAVSDIITDIPTLCNILNSHINALIEFNNSEEYEDIDENEAAAFEDAQNFICLQLIHMARSSELREEGSRRHFVSIMRRVLARLATPDDLVEACIRAMATAHDKESQFLQTISEILVDVEDDDTFHSSKHDDKAIVIVRQMRAIAILSVVLESLSGAMVSHPILDGFFQHMSPAITSKNAIVREHGVICLSKFCLLMDEGKVMEEFRPLLMTIVGSVEERAEVRAQAALALCDLSLIHQGMLLASPTEDDCEEVNYEGNVLTMPFKDMLLGMLGHAKPGIVIVAAEISAKLLLAGRLRDPKLVAWLVFVYFDTSLSEYYEEEDIDGAEVREVGSPVRLQQLLSIFFPTYSMSSLDANDDMMASVGPLLSIVNGRLARMRRIGKEAMVRWPIAKMVEYVCYTVDLVDKDKVQETRGGSNKGKEAEMVHSDQMSRSLELDPIEEKRASNDDGNSKEEHEEEEDEKEGAIEASSTLLASFDIAQFLAEEGADSAPPFYLRILAKILGSAQIDVHTEDAGLLRRLKSCVNEAEYANDDGPTVRSIRKLADLLADIEGGISSDDGSIISERNAKVAVADGSDEGEEAEEEAASGKNRGMEKENPRPSVGNVKSLTSSTGGERRTLNRMSLADVTCN